MLKVVLDTNVIVSALLKPRSHPARILRLIVQGDLKIIVNEHILSEYFEVLSRPKFDFDMSQVKIILELIRNKGIVAPSLLQRFNLPDSSDEPFLEAALATKADALITGNLKHFPENRCKNQRALSPKQFLAHLP